MATIDNKVSFENLFDKNLSVIANNISVATDEKKSIPINDNTALQLGFSNKFRKTITIVKPNNITVKLSTLGIVLNLLVVVGLIFTVGSAYLAFRNHSQIFILFSVLSWLVMVGVNFWGMRNNYDLNITNQ
ncbi:MAG: hypothetical protein QM632_03905 [Micrococcaceae bacterium]